jgi:hypothetical protein
MTEMTAHYATGLPRHMARLPIDSAGRPVPRFVEWIDGKPDFRVMSSKHMRHAIRSKACWICGDGLGKYMTFAVGPMCLINRVSAEPPSHHDCAEYSATHCPFLANPDRERRENNLPEDYRTSGGEMIARNPGVTALITTRSYTLVKVPNGLIFTIGTPERVEWFAEGRTATRAEVDASIESGLPILRAADAGLPHAAVAHAALDKQVADAERWLPA